MKDFNIFKREAFSNQELRAAYDELEAEYLLIAKLIQKRIDTGITQKELAEKMGTKQSAISRFESGSYHPTMIFMYKLAKAIGAELEVKVS